MINNRHTLNEYLNCEKQYYLPENLFSILRMRLLCAPEYQIWHYQKCLRLSEYHFNTGHRLRYAYYRRRKNIEGARLGIYINHNSVGKGLHIYHYGSIVIHEAAHIGNYLSLHGENCIGNKGVSSPESVPVIGDCCDIGIGAKVLGKITLGSNTIIGANAVVTKSFPHGSVTLAGIPARPLSSSKYENNQSEYCCSQERHL